MRKISNARKLWLDARSRRGAITKRRRKLEHRAWIIARRAGRDAPRSARVVELYSEGRTQYAIALGEARPAPTKLSLGEPEWDSTIKFISDVRSELTRILYMPHQNARRMRRSTSGLRINNYWDFSTIKYIGLHAALALASQYDRIKFYRAFVPKAVNIKDWDDSVVRVLRSIGFFSLSGVEAPIDETFSYSTGVLLRMTRCHNVDGAVIIEYLNKIGVDLTVIDPSLCDALMEAITNSVHHAWKYTDLCEEFTVPAWWIAAYRRTNEDGKSKIVIMIYDHGASIPATLPRWEKYGKIARILDRINRRVVPLSPFGSDGRAMQIAIKVGKTSTGQGNRGKGLRQIVAAADLCDSGSVTIYSRCGVVRHEKGGKTRSFNRTTPILGTMIVWDLTI